MERVVKPRVERVPGVASVVGIGVRQRSVYIDYDREKIFAHGLDLTDLQRRLGSDNFQMANGKMEDRSRIRHIRSVSHIEDVEALRRYPVRDDLVLADIATVELRGSEDEGIYRMNGGEAAALMITKESSANTIDVCRAVTEALAALESDPRVEGAAFYPLFSEGELISESINNLVNTALIGGLFAIVILFVFLREWRMTLLISASIPFSLLITIGVLYFRGDSLNVFSLMGLMLAVGMVVDNAIVVIETIYRRRAEGAGVRSAAVDGAAEVNLAIVMSTATTMVVFLPIMLMSENAAVTTLMEVLGFPVLFALAASLIVALVFAPLSTRYVGAAQVKPDARWLAWLTERYARSLRWMLRHRFDTVMGLLAILVLTNIPLQAIECSDEGEGHINNFDIVFSVPPAASLEDRDAVVRSIEDVLTEHHEAWGSRPTTPTSTRAGPGERSRSSWLTTAR